MNYQGFDNNDCTLTSFHDFNHYLKKFNVNPIEPSIDLAKTKPGPSEPQEIPTVPPIPRIPCLPTIPTIIQHKIIVLDSRDRDILRYPFSYNYQISSNVSSLRFLNDEDKFIPDSMNADPPDKTVTPGYASRPNVFENKRFVGATLEQDIKNVRNIKLEECIVPDFTADTPYLILRIPELQDIIDGTNNQLRTAFAILIPERVHGDFVTCKTKLNGICQKTFDPPLAKLTNLTLQFIDPTTNLYYNFTDETLCILKIDYEIPNKQAVLDYQIL